MRAVVIHGARDLRVEERPEAAPGPGEVAVAVEVGGICGSDLHYYSHGGFGTVRLREPMILGHEVAGRVVELGPDVAGLVVGDRVAVSPSRPCGACRCCLAGMANQCLHMRFYGSAMPFPHIQGAFSQRLVALASQCHRVAEGVSLAEAAMAEPFAVTLHAVARAGALIDRRVLVTGCGPIGALAIVAARVHGAREIVATDVVDGVLDLAGRLGADRVINVAREPEALLAYGADKGSFDVQLEASGSPAALRAGLEMLRPRGVLVLIGLGAEVSFPPNVLVAREVDLRGTFRFDTEFPLAVELINRRRVDLRPLVTATYPIEEALAAFEAAGDRSRAMKVQIALQG